MSSLLGRVVTFEFESKSSHSHDWRAEHKVLSHICQWMRVLIETCEELIPSIVLQKQDSRLKPKELREVNPNLVLKINVNGKEEANLQ